MANDDIYRIVYSTREAGSYYGEKNKTKIFQGGELNRMLTELLEAHLETKASAHFNEGRGPRPWLERIFAEGFWKYITSKPEIKVHRKIQRVEKHTTEGWVPVEYTFIEPKIVFDGETLP